MKRLGIIALALLLMLVGAACGKSESKDQGSAKEKIVLEDIVAQFQGAAEVVPTGEFQKYTVTLKDKAGNAVSVDKVYIFMNMEGMHHPTEGTMHEMDKGIYELELPLAMAGEWYAEVTLTQGDKELTLDRFKQMADGKKFMMYMKGYNADTGATQESGSNMDHNTDMNHDTEMNHETDTNMNHETEGSSDSTSH